MSNRLFQSVIHQMKDVIDRTIGVIDETGVVIACSELVKIGEVRQNIRDEMAYTTDMFVSGGYTYRPLSSGVKREYVIFVEGEDGEADKTSRMLAVALSNIKNLYDEKYDKGSFIKNIILDNILPSDIYIKSKELHFNAEESRIVFLIKFYGKTDMMPFEMLQNMFPDKARDYVISVGEHDIVLVKEVKTGSENKEMEKIATNIVDTLSSEFYTKVSIGVSTIVDNIRIWPEPIRRPRSPWTWARCSRTKRTLSAMRTWALAVSSISCPPPSARCSSRRSSRRVAWNLSTARPL